MATASDLKIMETFFERFREIQNRYEAKGDWKQRLEELDDLHKVIKVFRCTGGRAPSFYNWIRRTLTREIAEEMDSLREIIAYESKQGVE